MSHVTVLITILETATLLFGGLITYYSLKAYRRTGAPALRALTVGFAVVTVGVLLAGVLDLLVPVGRRVALLVESGFTAAGFGILLYSLHAD